MIFGSILCDTGSSSLGSIWVQICELPLIGCWLFPQIRNFFLVLYPFTFAIESHYVDLAGLKHDKEGHAGLILTEIHLSLLREC